MRKTSKQLRRVGAVLMAVVLATGVVAAEPVQTDAKTKAKKMKITPATKTLYVGGPASKKSVKLKVTITPAKASQKVTYKSSNKKVATVSSKGKVTAKKKGKATITVTSKSNKRLKKKIKITVKKYKAGTTTQNTDTSDTTSSNNNAGGTSTTPTATPVNNAGGSAATATPAGGNSTTTSAPAGGTSAPTGDNSTSTATPSGNTSGATATPATNGGGSTATPTPATNAGGSTATATPSGSITTEKYTGDYDRVSVHDPSIVVGYYEGTYTNKSTVYGTQNEDKTRKEIYFVFGSHMAWAYSLDLANWKTFTNNINTDYSTIFAKDAEWSALGSSSYDVKGNLWAPDVIWNPTLGKWCMYMSVNGNKWYTSVVLLTSDSLNGDWTRVGPVVYSGFTTADEASKTDLFKVIGGSEVPERYTLRSDGGQAVYNMNAIDPCVIYDGDDLWMSYGSWFGGIYMIKLDAETGLRDYSTIYETKDNVSDAYQGYYIAGGNNVSGEASYIQKIGSEYYLFMSYGALEAAGGYNMRVFSADKITGPYTDLSGEDARRGMSTSTEKAINSGAGSINGTTGTRLMSYYKWSFMDKGYVAQGHNSAFVDDDGKSYVVYHTRFSDGADYHELRVHQLFQAKNGGLVTAPFEYAGETLSDTAYDTKDVTGTYRILTMSGTDYKSLECVTEKEIELKEDGTVTGEYTGNWEQTADGPYLTITSGGVTYQGVFVQQKLENLDYTTMCLTVVGGNDVAIWGYQPLSGEQAVKYSKANLSIPSTTYSGTDLSFPTKGTFDETYSWKSSDTTIVTNEGQVQEVNVDKTVTLTCTISSGGASDTKKFTLSVLAKNPTNMIPGISSGKNEVVSSADTVGAFKEETPSDKITSTTGLSISFYVEDVTSDWDTILRSSDSKYFMHLAVLSYKGLNIFEQQSSRGEYATKNGYTGGNSEVGNLWTAYLNKKCYVTVSFNPDGSIAYYLDGEKVLTYGANLTPLDTSSGSITPKQVVQAVISYYKQGKLEFDKSVTNIKISYGADFDLTSYVKPDYGEYLYYADYDSTGGVSDWTTNNDDASASLVSSSSDSESLNNYIQFKNSSTRAAQSLYNQFGINFTGVTDYTVEFDASLTGGDETKTANGVTGGRSDDELVLYTATNEMYEKNRENTANYIFSLRYANDPTDSGSTTRWYINTTSASGDANCTIPSGTWVHISLYVDGSKKKVNVKITGNGDSSIYSEELAINGDSTELAGIYAAVARNNKGAICLDNIKVYKGTQEPTSDSTEN